MISKTEKSSDCVTKLQGMSFSEIVSLFDRFISLESFEERPKSRDRIFSDVRTFWMFLAQIIWGNLSCDAIIQRAVSWLESETKKEISFNTSGYTQARQRLPFSMIRQASGQTRDKLPPGKLFHGHAVKQVDGSGVPGRDTEPWVSCSQCCSPGDSLGSRLIPASSEVITGMGSGLDS